MVLIELDNEGSQRPASKTVKSAFGCCRFGKLVEDLFVVSFGDPYKIVEFGLDLGVPVLVIVQQLRVQVVAEQGAAGGADVAEFTGLDGEDVAALFVTVKGFHFFSF